MCSRITSVFISLSQGGQTGEYPKTEDMLSVKYQEICRIKNQSVIVTKYFIFFVPKKIKCDSLTSLLLTLNSGEPITVQKDENSDFL